MDSVMVFDDKALFDKALLTLSGADTSMQLPPTYFAALERRVLIVMSPGYCARVYPEGNEPGSYPKLLAHEMAHRLHIRILGGNEEANVGDGQIGHFIFLSKFRKLPAL